MTVILCEYSTGFRTPHLRRAVVHILYEVYQGNLGFRTPHLRRAVVLYPETLSLKEIVLEPPI